MPDLALARFEREEHLLASSGYAYPSKAEATQGIPRLKDLDFFGSQKRVILRDCGSIDPMSIKEAMARGTYRGAFKALTKDRPEKTIETVKQSGLRGRGGAAFPTGQKWALARAAEADRP